MILIAYSYLIVHRMVVLMVLHGMANAICVLGVLIRIAIASTILSYFDSRFLLLYLSRVFAAITFVLLSVYGNNLRSRF